MTGHRSDRLADGQAMSGDDAGRALPPRAAQNGRTRDHRRSAASSSYSVGRDASVKRCPLPGVHCLRMSSTDQ